MRLANGRVPVAGSAMNDITATCPTMPKAKAAKIDQPCHVGLFPSRFSRIAIEANKNAPLRLERNAAPKAPVNNLSLPASRPAQHNTADSA